MGFINAANQRVIMQAIAAAKSNQAHGDFTGTNNGAVGTSHYPNGTVFEISTPGLGTYSFAGVLVSAGPNGESDYTDARYFVREVLFVQPPSSSPSALPTMVINTSPGAFWGPCMNAMEVATGTHLLPVYSGSTSVALTGTSVTPVQVQMVQGVATDVGNSIFVFSALAIGQNVSFYVTSATGTIGLYRVKTIIPGTATLSGFGTKSATEDAYFWNGAETSGISTVNNLLVAPNTTTFDVMGSGTVVGIDAASGKRIIAGWMGFAACTNADIDSDYGTW